MPNFKNVEYFDQNQILFVNYLYGEWLRKRNLTVSKILEYGIIDFLIDYKGDKKEIDYIGNLFLSVGRPENVKVYIKGTEKNILAKKRKMNIPLDSLD